MSKEIRSIWNPLQKFYTRATIIYNKKTPIKIIYANGYIVTDPSYIEDILYESKIITQKSDTWVTT